jgi:hypothetical protein
MPLEPQFQKTVETKYPVGNEGLPGGNRPPGGAPPPPAAAKPPAQ